MAPSIGGAVFVSALTGYGMETLRAEMAAVLASLWVDVDVALPYAAGELLARVRERGTVDIEYRERDVPLVTAARMSATFPYISPVARIDVDSHRPAYHLADGGYFDNSGVVSAIEWIRWHLDQPASMLRQRGVRRILILRLSIRAAKTRESHTRVGWRNATLGPLLTMMHVRTTSQTEHVEQELQLGLAVDEAHREPNRCRRHPFARRPRFGR